MRNDHGADGNGALDGLCSKQYVCDGQRPVYDLQPVAGGCACSIDRRERAAISSRFALYSASIAPHLRGASKRQTLAVAATLTEEAYGISLAKLVEGEDWGPRESFVLNVILIATWGVSCTMGAIVGAVVDVPTAIATFVCTSLFICLLFSQRLSRGNVVAAVSGAVSVAVCKFLGLANIAVPASVVVGIAIALACDAVFDGRGARDAR